MQGCRVDGCTRSRLARGMCAMHYQRWKKDGDAGGVEVRRREAPSDRLCTVGRCRRDHYGRGMCLMHWMRWYRTGDVRGDLPEIDRTNQHWVNRWGYVVVSVIVDGKRRHKMQHRIVMEEALGRDLTADETVHHINGVRDDNRPENLELWSKSQPPGQRVADKVEWAKELLRRYEPEALR